LWFRFFVVGFSLRFFVAFVIFAVFVIKEKV